MVLFCRERVVCKVQVIIVVICYLLTTSGTRTLECVFIKCTLKTYNEWWGVGETMTVLQWAVICILSESLQSKQRILTGTFPYPHQDHFFLQNYWTLNVFSNLNFLCRLPPPQTFVLFDLLTGTLNTISKISLKTSADKWAEGVDTLGVRATIVRSILTLILICIKTNKPVSILKKRIVNRIVRESILIW